MNETLKQLSDDVAKELKAKFASKEFTDFVANVKAAGDDRTFEVVMSTSDEDRQGDALDQSGWDFTYFKLNPVVLWAHDYSGFPIGIVTDIRVDGDRTITTGKFAPAGLNPTADIACALYQQGILKTVSPGYIQNDDGTRELLEQSFCSVPAGRYALSLRQVQTIGLSTRELVTKGFFYKDASPPAKKAADDPVIGDGCELDDGTPGVLAEDPKNPGRLVCVPPEEGKKSNQTQSNMNDELQKKLKTEHERHGGAVVKAIDEFEKSIPEQKSEDESDMKKSIEEFETKMEDEHEDHLAKCMKAIDDTYEDFGREDGKKSIDEFKKAVEDEHLKHVKCFDKAIEEFKGEAEPNKAIEEFRTKAEDELTRHEKAHMDMCKTEFGEGEDEGKKKGLVTDIFMRGAADREIQERLNYVMTVMYALCEASWGVEPTEFFPLLEEAIELIEAYAEHEKNGESDAEEAAEGDSQKRTIVDRVKAIRKSGRAISAANRTKIESVIKAIEEFHAEHTADHQQFTEKAIAALKELSSSPGDEGKEGEDQKSHTPNARSSSAGAATNSMSELEAYLFAQRLVRQVKSASEDGLRQLKDVLRTKFPSRR